MRIVFWILLLIGLSANAQPASFGFLTYKQSTLTLFTSAAASEIRTITAQELGEQPTCCIHFAWRGAMKTSISETVTSEGATVYAYEISAPPFFKRKEGYMGQVLLNANNVKSQKFFLKGRDQQGRVFTAARCLSSEGIHLYPLEKANTPAIYFHLDYEIDLNEIGNNEQVCSSTLGTDLSFFMEKSS